MGLSFLALPQSDQQLSENSTQFSQGAAQGAKNVQDFEDTQFANEQAAQKSKDAKDKAATALQNKLLERQIGENVKVNDQTYSNLHAGLTNRIADLQREAESGDRDPDALKTSIGKTREALQALDIARGQNVAKNPTGLHQYDPSFYDIAGVPQVAPMTPAAGAAKTGKQMSETYGGFESKSKYDATAGAGPKIAPAAESARDNFDAALQNLVPHTQRVIDATRFYQANKNDPKAESAYTNAAKDWGATRDKVRGNYSAMIDRLTDGGFGGDAKQTFQSIAKGLPENINLNDISNHDAIASRVEDLIAPFEAAQQKRALTPAETQGYLQLSNLRNLLKTKTNLSQQWQNSELQNSNTSSSGDNPSGVSPLLKAPLTMPAPQPNGGAQQ